MRFDGQPWAPTRYTPPLAPGPILSDGPRLISLVERHYRVAQGDDPSSPGALLTLDDWQRALLTHVLERYPRDWPDPSLRSRLRYRQVVISLGRQNGKSVLGAILALYGLLQHVAGPNVVGVAKSVEQARVVYSRVEYAVRRDAALNRRLKPSGTRGIKRRDFAGSYECRPALDEGLQSQPITLCIADELHLTRPAMWDSIVQGQRAQRDALVVGITTAGDAKSLLLKRLYDRGDRAIADSSDGRPARFGFFLWEAPDGATLHTPGAIEAANPAIACGRIDRETAIQDIVDQPEADIQRYALNRFVAAATAWVPASDWRSCSGHHLPAHPDDLVVGIRRTDGWEYATLAGACKTADGRIVTELVATLVRPTLDTVVAVAGDLASRHPVSYAVTSDQSDIGKALRDAGHEVYILGHTEMSQAGARAWAAITKHTLGHAGDALTTAQIPHARRVSTGGTSKVAGGDAVIATIAAVHVADTKPPRRQQLF